MPVIIGSDNNGCFARWGRTGKKYYYRCGSKNLRKRARAKAERQGRAVYAGGYGG